MPEIGESFRGPDGRVGYLLRQAQLAFRNAVERELRVVAMTAPQYSVLSVLGRTPGASGAQLARDSMLTPQTVHAILRTLEDAGMVERRDDPRDQRVRTVHLTAAGRDTLDEATPLVHALEARMVASLSEADERRLRSWLVVCAEEMADRDAGLS